MPKVEHNNITFASEDELELFHWLTEAREHGLIERFAYQSPTWQLSEPVIETIEQYGKRGQKIKPRTRVLLKGVTYTADFHVVGAKPAVPISEYVDVKPKFTRRDSEAAKFSLIRKWLYQRHGALVQSVVPYELFCKTFAPAETRLTPKRSKPRSGYADLPTVEEYVERLYVKGNRADGPRETM
jgi:hypothetical protein